MALEDAVLLLSLLWVSFFGIIIMASASSYNLLLFGRVFVGLGVGIGLAVSISFNWN